MNHRSLPNGPCWPGNMRISGRPRQEVPKNTKKRGSESEHKCIVNRACQNGLHECSYLCKRSIGQQRAGKCARLDQQLSDDERKDRGTE